MVRLNSLLILIAVSSVAVNAKADLLCNVSGLVTVVHAAKCPSKSKKINLTPLIAPPSGIKGDVGAIGKVGARGEKGQVGPKGPQGDKGLQGSQGRVGSKGERGVSGATGPKGLNGDLGNPGAIGAKGAQGPKGDTGSGPGPRGLDGAIGPRGPAGEVGIAGPRGNPGPNGNMSPISSCVIWPVVSTAAIPPDPSVTRTFDDVDISVACPTNAPVLWKHSFNASRSNSGAPLKTSPVVKFHLITLTVTDKSYTFANGLDIKLRLSKINGQFENGDYLADLVCCPLL